MANTKEIQDRIKSINDTDAKYEGNYPLVFCVKNQF